MLWHLFSPPGAVTRITGFRPFPCYVLCLEGTYALSLRVNVMLLMQYVRRLCCHHAPAGGSTLVSNGGASQAPIDRRFPTGGASPPKYATLHDGGRRRLSDTYMGVLSGRSWHSRFPVPSLHISSLSLQWASCLHR